MLGENIFFVLASSLRDSANTEYNFSQLAPKRVLRMKPDSLPRTALNWAPEGKRKRGRPRETRRRTVEKERSQMEFKTWTEAARTAIDRKRWKDTVKSPILQAK